jgi:hypothetical protein
MGEAEIVSGKLPLAKKTGYGSIEFSGAIPWRLWRMSWPHENTGWDGILVLFTGKLLCGGQYQGPVR